MRGARTIFGNDLRELVDLYRWGARVRDLCMLFDVQPQTIRATLKREGVPMRPPHRAPLAAIKPHSSKGAYLKSTRPTIPEGVRYAETGQEPDQLLRSSAHAQRDRRIAARRLDASTRSCREEAS